MACMKSQLASGIISLPLIIGNQIFVLMHVDLMASNITTELSPVSYFPILSWIILFHKSCSLRFVCLFGWLVFAAVDSYIFRLLILIQVNT